jgi:hypothetical protein
MLKHIGKMKHNGSKVCVIYRTLPGDAFSALVVGTSSLSEAHHNTLMTELETPQGQQSNELGDHLSNRYFTDGTNILEQLHIYRKLVKVATSDVVMTPTLVDEVPLDELNVMIAEQKGVTLADLAIKADMPHKNRPETKTQDIQIEDLTKKPSKSDVVIDDQTKPKPAKELTTARDYRSEADRLYKEAARLKKIADDLDPPKKKESRGKVNEEAPQ